MQKLSRYNRRIKFIFVAVDTLSRFVGALHQKVKCVAKITETLRARKYISTDMMTPKFLPLNSKTEPKLERIWVDKAESLPVTFFNSVDRMILNFIRHIVKPNRHLLSETSVL